MPSAAPDPTTGSSGALDSVPCGILRLSLQGSIRDLNRAVSRLLGASHADLLGTTFVQCLSRGGAIFYETQFVPSLLLRRSLEEISFDLRCSDGHTEPVFVNAVIARAPDSADEEIILAIFSARQRRLYEAELLRARREAEQISEIVRRSPDAIIRFTADAAIESWNDGSQQIFGEDVARCTGKPITCLFPPEAHAELDDAVARLREGEHVVLETRGLRSSGELIDVSVSLTPHMEAPGTLVAFSGIIRDTTARRSAERALIQNEKLASVGRLASSIAHEINNPLEAVTNLLYILGTRKDADAEWTHLVQTAQEELARVSHIATHTLRFHRQSTGRAEVQLITVIESVLALYRARLLNSSIHTTIDCPPQLSLTCFEGELRQLLVNLIGNAFDAMRSGGLLRVRVRQTHPDRAGGQRVRIVISDSGSGIPPEVREHLFQPFISTKGIGGTGLGLWITKGLVQKNGGTIAVRSSTTPGSSGTVVRLTFPC